MDKQHIRYYIKTRSLLGLTASQIHQELVTAYGQECVSYPTVARWHHAFSSGEESIEDDPHSGRPITAVTQDNIAAVKDLVDDNPYISIDYIADVLSICPLLTFDFFSFLLSFRFHIYIYIYRSPFFIYNEMPWPVLENGEKTRMISFVV